MTNLCSELSGVSLRGTVTALGLRLEPSADGAVILPHESDMDAKRFRRQISALKGYLALLRAERGEAPLVLTDGMLPETEGPEVTAAVWYDRAACAADDRSRMMSLYNGYGCLPGGFAAVKETVARWADTALAEKLLRHVAAVRRSEDDFGREEMPPVPETWAEEEIRALEHGLLKAIRQAF